MAATTQILDVRAEALRALREGRDLDELRQLIAHEQLHSRRPGAHLDRLLSLVAEVYRLSHVRRPTSPSTCTAWWRRTSRSTSSGKVDERNLRYALNYPALVAGGLQPDLAKDRYYWRSDLWPYVVHAITA